MQIPRLSISSVQARIGMETQPSVQSISQPSADLQIEQKAAILEINTSKPQLAIDQSGGYASLHLKSIFDFLDEEAMNSIQAGLMGIEQISAEGDRMRAIETKENAIANMSAEDSVMFNNQYTFPDIPIWERVKISYTPSEVSINVTTRGANINSKMNPPIIDYTPAKTNIYLQQKNSIDITVVGANVDERV